MAGGRGNTNPLNELNAGVGDEVVMIGRFVAHDGRVRNAALARFGNIAMMPGEPVTDGRGMKVEAFLVEMRSLSGFSGSPAFIYMGPGTYRGDGRMMPFYSETIGLIGIDWAQDDGASNPRRERSANCPHGGSEYRCRDCCASVEDRRGPGRRRRCSP